MGKSQLGVSLIEVMVSVFLLTLMIFQLEGIYFIVTKTKISHYNTHIARRALHSLIDAMNANPTLPPTTHLSTWNEQNKRLLPNGFGTIKEMQKQIDISIFWGSRTDATCDHERLGHSGCLPLKLRKEV